MSTGGSRRERAGTPCTNRDATGTLAGTVKYSLLRLVQLLVLAAWTQLCSSGARSGHVLSGKGASAPLFVG